MAYYTRAESGCRTGNYLKKPKIRICFSQKLSFFIRETFYRRRNTYSAQERILYFAVSVSMASSRVVIPLTIGKKASIPAWLQAAASFVTLPAKAIVFAPYFFPSFATPTGAFPIAV